MTDDAFLADIIEHPDDDAPRLVYADWLDDRGAGDRATFIRAQCRLARMSADDPARPDLERQEAELLGLYGREWRENLGDEVRDATYRRGFVEHIRMKLKAFLAFAQPLFRRAPIRTATLLNGWKEVKALARSRWLARLTSLELSGEGDYDGLDKLAASGHLSGLTALSLMECWGGDSVALALARSPHLAPLETLDLRYNDIRKESALALINSDALSGMTTLLLDENSSMDDSAIGELLQRPGLTRLRGLHLGYHLSEDSVVAVAECPRLSGLTRLDLTVSGLSTRAARALATSPYLTRLTSLDIGRNSLTPEGLAVLLGSPVLRSVSALHLACNPLGPEGARQLASWEPLSRLRTLDLTGTDLADEGVEALVGSPHLHRLTVLGLHDNAITDRGIAALAGCAGLSALRRLLIGANNFSAVGARALAESPHFRRLVRLEVSSDDIPGDANTILTEHFGARLAAYW